MPEFSPEIHENSVFPSSYEKSVDDKFLRLKENPDYFIKEITPEWLNANGPRRADGEGDVDYLRRVAERGQADQREFAEETGIKAAGSQLFVGSNENNQTVLFRVTQQVHGSDLEDAIRSGHVSEEDLMNMLTSMFKYMKGRFGTDQDVMADVQFLQQWEELFAAGRAVGKKMGITTEEQVYKLLED